MRTLLAMAATAPLNHFVDGNKMVSCHLCAVWGWICYTAQHIRPLAVSPLTYPESVPNPWGCFISGLSRARPV